MNKFREIRLSYRAIVFRESSVMEATVNFCLYFPHLLSSVAESRYATSARNAADHPEFHENRRRDDGASAQLHNFFPLQSTSRSNTNKHPSFHTTHVQ